MVVELVRSSHKILKICCFDLYQFSPRVSLKLVSSLFWALTQKISRKMAQWYSALETVVMPVCKEFGSNLNL